MATSRARLLGPTVQSVLVTLLLVVAVAAPTVPADPAGASTSASAPLTSARAAGAAGAAGADGLRGAGRRDPLAWAQSRPPAAEWRAVEQALAAAGGTGGALHVVHVSTGEAVGLVTAARARGVDATLETCPHYLALDERDLARIGPLAKCAPPLRAPEQREALWTHLLEGRIDLVASDHSPCLLAEKTCGAADIWAAWGGISGLQSTLPVLLTEGVHRRGLDLRLLARLAARRPAERFGLAGKGDLAPGSDADFVLVDPDAAFVLRAEDLQYRNRHSVYVGRAFRGRVRGTWLRGTCVFDGTRTLTGGEAGRLLGGGR